ncbi:MAG TPA: hypothetical protein VJT49_09910 [Amycolatopsis sp.]|uniref:hypothetical protein n=1 Tax=Amycolatopsis sp. TaxID=37632 RepID=UPI002B46F67C|nr:hypothetical protein [Amycolatopsis sp.]HKS45412.1 hypothetical protein [Amycolatopsis sp.]
MTTEPTTTPPAPPAWGDPGPPAPKWSGGKTAVAAAVTVAIVAVGGAAIYAGTSANNSSGLQGPRGMRGFGGPGDPMGGFDGRGGGMSLPVNALHGDFVVSSGGSYLTERLQRGTVSAVSATSVTVKSADDYTQTYTIDSSTRKANDVATGAEVTVIAKVSGGTATATTITDGEQQDGPGGFPHGGNGQGGQGIPNG